MRGLFAVGCIVSGLFFSAYSSAAEPPLLPLPPPPLLGASSYLLLEAETGKVIVEHNADKRLPAASLAKIMTSYLLSEQLHSEVLSDDEYVRVSRRAWAQNPAFKGSSLMFIEPAKPVRLGDLHKGLIVSSGNDASIAIAEHLSGTEENFVELMNHRARQLGMTNTNFANPHGLSSELPDYTSARDILMLTREFIRNFPAQYKLYSLDSFSYNGLRQRNRNRLLGRVKGLDGVKTGYTSEAGYCLVSSAERDGMRLIAAVFGAQTDNSRFTSTRRLLEYGFRYFEVAQLVNAGQVVDELELWGGRVDTVELQVAEDIRIVLPKGRQQLLEQIVDVPHRVEAPVKAGEQLGMLVLYLGGTVLARVPLLSSQSVDRAVFWRRYSQLLERAVIGWWRQHSVYRWLYGS